MSINKLKIIVYIKSLDKRLKKLIVLLGDVIISLFCVWLAFSIRLEEYHQPDTLQVYYYAALTIGFVPVFLYFNIYNHFFRYFNLVIIKDISKACFTYSFILFFILFYSKLPNIPRSIGLIYPLLFLIFIYFFRIIIANILNSNLKNNLNQKFLIYGAGVDGIQFLIRNSNKFIQNVIGYLDDDTEKQGRIINGKKIFSPNLLSSLIKKYEVTDVLLCLPGIDLPNRKRIIENLINLNLKVSTIPDLKNMVDENFNIPEFRPLNTQDILFRKPYNNNNNHLKLINKTVLVVGAGGSIGSEICRQILKQKIKKIILLDNSEYNLYKIDLEINELKKRYNHKCSIYTILASAREQNRIEQIFRDLEPNIVFHAAAYKHVNLVEKNKIEALTNNFDTTLILSDLSIKYRVKNFTFISTDKAVNPSNIMGASKRLAELIIQKQSLKKTKTIFTTVRFGNVIGSSGSIIPLFQSQIQHGGPITLTHKSVSRYFMTIPEAVDLVLSASNLTKKSDTFILDMGKPIKIIDIAKKMIALSGKTEKTKDYPNGDIEIKVIGLRPGEKLKEELFLGDKIFKTLHPQILKIKEHNKTEFNMKKLTNEFKIAILSDDEQKIRSFYQSLSNI